MKDKRFIEALDRLNIRDSRREELLGEILLRAEAEEREQKYMKKSRRSGRRGARPWRALAPIFAVVLIIGAVLLVQRGRGGEWLVRQAFRQEQILRHAAGEPGEYAGCGGGDTDSEG